MAAGLVVAFGTPASRAADEVVIAPPAPIPAGPPPGAGPGLAPPATQPAPAAVPIPVAGGAAAVQPGMGGLRPGAIPPDYGCGDKVYEGGMGYLLSSGCGAGGCTSSMNYWKADVLFLHRDIDNPRTMISAQFPNGDVISESLGRDDFGWDPALRVTYGRALIECSACDCFFEATYFGLHHANISRDVIPQPGVATLFGSPLAPLFDVTTGQTFSYVSDLHSLEGNIKVDYYLDNTLYFLAGLRFIRFDDRLHIREIGAMANPPGFIPQAFENVDVTNNMIGVQVGFDWQTRDLTSRWNLGAYGRAGLYANMLDGHIRQGANDSNLHGPFINEINPGRLQGSGALEGGFTATWRAAPNLYIRGGYHVLWLGAIALAPDQPTPDITDLKFNGRLSNNQDVFFHGPFVGLEYHWGCCR